MKMVNIKVEIFDDPELCSVDCVLMRSNLCVCEWPGKWEFIDIIDGKLIKHDRCKAAFNQ